MTHIFGCWSVEPGQPALMNSLTGEQVRFNDRALIDRPAQVRGWVRFDYHHADLQYPVMVEITSYAYSGIAQAPNWRIDHGRSAEVWCGATNSDKAYPPYGVWRRVDDCVTDALACWPDLFPTDDRLGGNLAVDGGWLNGQWDSGLHRRFVRLSESSKKRFSRSIDPNAGTWIVPIGTDPPSPFEFHRLPQEAGVTDRWSRYDAPIPIANEILLDGFAIHEPGRRPLTGRRGRRSEFFSRRELRLPAQLALTGLQGRVPYLLAKDGSRILYAYAVPLEGLFEKSRGGEIMLLYADSDVLCEVLARPDAEGWRLSPNPAGFGRRRNEATSDIFETPGVLGLAPNRELSLRLHWALLDGWLNWRGTRASPERWFGKLRLHPAKFVLLTNGYRGGLFLGLDAMCDAHKDASESW